MIEETMHGNARPEVNAPKSKNIESEIESLLKSLILDVFSTSQGKRLLDLWDDLYLRQVTWKPGVPEGFAEYRAGQNHVILSIRAILNQAKMAGSK